MSDFNKQIIEEFRANGGKVGGFFEGATLLLLHTIGAKSGLERINPVVYLANSNRYVVIASKAGADTHPDWYHNIVANPEVTVEVGSETFAALASIAAEPERTELYEKMEARHTGFTEYKNKTTRVIPVITLSAKS
ncbi:MAG: nitroreductase family deazaflavin-dependent oxidoreductase [Anaerolineae bacterium]|nr:nitroreductase family deazaflavin-dependent oxidoreductase [Anaerolineae bacterium]